MRRCSIELGALSDLKEGGGVRLSQIEAMAAVWSQPKGHTGVADRHHPRRCRSIHHLISMEELDLWYGGSRDGEIQGLLQRIGVEEAYKSMKIWRALCGVVGTLKKDDGKFYRDKDPSLGIRRKAPKGRTAIWTEGEAVHLVKAAWRAGYRDLAPVLASPGIPRCHRRRLDAHTGGDAGGRPGVVFHAITEQRRNADYDDTEETGDGGEDELPIG
jgi:hypothetical protein